ncbi:MAG: DNA repair protein RecN [Solirubrobacteraceae bacterium]
MLKHLFIANYILIEDVNVTFNKNLTIITGETGAGKSILLGALRLIMGERAELSFLKDKDKKCVVEASFNIKNLNFSAFFLENDLDYLEETIIRREILPSGKSRSFINDTPVTLNILQEFTIDLIDIHSQFSNNQLKNPNFFITILDAFTNTNLLLNYKLVYKEFKQCEKRVEELKSFFTNNNSQKEYNDFLLEELLKYSFKEEEQEELETEQNLLANSKDIISAIDKSIHLLENENQGIIFSLSDIQNLLLKVEKESNEIVEFKNRISTVKIELNDLLIEMNKFISNLEINPEKLFKVQQRLDLLYQLQNKHKVKTIKELLEIQEKLNSSNFELENVEQNIQELTQKKDNLFNQLTELSNKISKERLTNSKQVESELEKTLIKLGIENAKFSFEFQDIELTLNGKDKIKLNFSANKGVEFKPLDKIASGGEIARISLAIKKIISSHLNLPTLVLDEIDTGISGRVANQMGEILMDMSTNMQIFNITHNPQIAAKGNNHLKVFKETTNLITKTFIKPLNQEEKVLEVAQLLSGNEVTELAIAQAKELLRN